MAELDIGQHCGISSCKQLDFLPFTCDGCSGVFCLAHRSTDAHCCTQVNVQYDRKEYSGPKSYECSFAGCENRELTEIVCEHCHLKFCLSHRHQQDHECSHYEKKEPSMQQTTKHVQQILESKDSAKRKKGTGRKSKVTAAKVALMKLKQKAVGEKGTPEMERVYLNVCLPSCHINASQAMFFSKVWSIGRIIDKAASNAQLKNENNIGVSSVKKLRLFDADTGHIFNTADSLDSVMQGEQGLLNGGSVILEYVGSDCDQLLDVDMYVKKT